MEHSVAVTKPSTLNEEKPAMSITPSLAKVDSVMKGDEALLVGDGDGSDQSNGGVRLVEMHEYKKAALALAEAFAKDHVSLYFLDTPDRVAWTAEQKWQLHVKTFDYVVYAHLLKGLVVTAGPDMDCVALW